MPKLATKRPESKAIPLDRGRRLELSRSTEGDDVVEVRSPSGQLELRIVLTEQGPVLQLEAVKLALSASESVEIDCERFAVKAREQAVIESAGDVSIKADGELESTSTGDTRIAGKMIYLN
jgi:phage gp45-like